jgi:hypothetical protein
VVTSTAARSVLERPAVMKGGEVVAALENPSYPPGFLLALLVLFGCVGGQGSLWGFIEDSLWPTCGDRWVPPIGLPPCAPAIGVLLVVAGVANAFDPEFAGGVVLNSVAFVVSVLVYAFVVCVYRCGVPASIASVFRSLRWSCQAAADSPSPLLPCLRCL